MQRITTLLQKINDIASKDGEATVIDIDLMMDYTRVVYADLLEWRSRVSFNSSLNNEPPSVPAPSPQSAIPTVAVAAQDIAQPLPKPPEPHEDMEAEPVAAATPIQQPQSTPKPMADIRKWIGINDKYQFISELFGNDKDAYEDMLLQINQMPDYNTAAAFLDDVHTERQWNDEDACVQSFYGVVSQFFSER